MWTSFTFSGTLPGMPNIEKLDELVTWATMEHAKKQAGLPNEWDQGRYLVIAPAENEVMAHCGTACCLAGKTVLDAGAFPVASINDIRYFAETGLSRMEVVSAVYPDGTEVSVHEEAQRLLGLNGSQANALFNEMNKLEHVIEIVNQIKSGDPSPCVSRYADEDY